MPGCLIMFELASMYSCTTIDELDQLQGADDARSSLLYFCDLIKYLFYVITVEVRATKCVLQCKMFSIFTCSPCEIKLI